MWQRERQPSASFSFGECTLETEAAFHALLQRYRAEGRSNKDIAEAVIGNMFINGLVRLETGKRYHARNSEIRDAWRAETLILIAEACLKSGMLGCDLERPSIGGFWRVVVRRKASNARRTIVKEFGSKDRAYVLNGEFDVDGLADTNYSSTNRPRDVEDLRLDLRMAVSRIEDSRVRLMMLKLMSRPYTYAELAEELGFTVNQVRYDVERGKAILRRVLSNVAA